MRELEGENSRLGAEAAEARDEAAREKAAAAEAMAEAEADDD